MIEYGQSGYDGTCVVSNPVKPNGFSSVGIVGILLAILLILNMIDGVLTLWWVLSNRVAEANPLMANLIQAHPLFFMLAKLALVNLGAMLLWRLRAQSLAVLSVFLMVLVYGIVMCCHLMVV